MWLLVILRPTIRRVMCVYWNPTRISDWSRLTVRLPPRFVYFIPASMQWRVQRERRKNDALWQIGGHCYSVNLPFLQRYHSHTHLCTDWTRFKEKDIWTCLNRYVFPLALGACRSRCWNRYSISDWSLLSVFLWLLCAGKFGIQYKLCSINSMSKTTENGHFDSALKTNKNCVYCYAHAMEVGQDSSKKSFKAEICFKACMLIMLLKYTLNCLNHPLTVVILL